MCKAFTVCMTWFIILLPAMPAWAVYAAKQSSTAYPLLFFMVDSSDHVSGKTGLSPTVTLRKSNASAAGSFASPSGTVREIANGWYQIDGNATDTDTLGPLILHATATGADPTDAVFEVVAFDPQDTVRLGLTAVPNAASGSAGAIITSGSGTAQLSVSSGVAAANVTQFGGSNGTFSGGRPEVNLTHAGGIAMSTEGTGNFRSFYTIGYGPLLHRGNISSVTSATVFTLGSNPFNDVGGLADGCTIVIYDDEGSHKAVRTIVSQADSGGATIITIDSSTGFTLTSNSVVEILPPGFAAPDRTTANATNTRVTTALPNAGPGATNGLFIAGTNAATSIPGGLTANITGNLSGSVNSVTGNVGGNVVGSVGSVSGLTITSGRVNADVTHWLGDPLVTPTVDGLPAVDITHVLGSPVCD